MNTRTVLASSPPGRPRAAGCLDERGELAHGAAVRAVHADDAVAALHAEVRRLRRVPRRERAHRADICVLGKIRSGGSNDAPKGTAHSGEEIQ